MLRSSRLRRFATEATSPLAAAGRGRAPAMVIDGRQAICQCPCPTRVEAMTTDDERLDAMARWMWDARQRREIYRNLPDALRPASLDEAYAAQEVYHRLAEPVYGPVRRRQDRHHHQGHAGADGHLAPVRRRDLRAHHSCLAGAAAGGGFRQPAHRKRDRARARRRRAGVRRAVDGRERLRRPSPAPWPHSS